MVTGKSVSDIAVLATDSKPLAIGLTALLLSIPPVEEVHVLESVEELLGRVANLRPTLILFDTAIAGYQPAQALGEVRSSAPDTPVVILCSNMDEYRTLLAEGDDPVIMKGTEPGQLARMVESLLQDRVAA